MDDNNCCVRERRGGQRHRHTERQRPRHTDTQRDRHIDIQKHIDIQIHRETYRYT